MKNKIWYKPTEEKPITYSNIIMEFPKPFGNQLSEDEQDPVYECYQMKYYGDGDNHEWEVFKQCNRWCYLDDLIQCSEDICTISDTFLDKHPEYEDWFKLNFDYLEK